ncbi:hypothetical protein O1L55_20690 [Streptomyces albulus]|nr:hypothetical protein [Streptomyces noursei]
MTDTYPNPFIQEKQYAGTTGAGTIVQAEKLAATAIELLQRQLVLPTLFDKHAEGEFKGALGDVINIRRPSRLRGSLHKDGHRKSRTADPDQGGAAAMGIMTNKYQASDLNEYAIQVQLAEDLYSAINIPDEVATLDIQSYAMQVLEPQVRGLAERYEDFLAECMETSFQPYDNDLIKGGKGEIDVKFDDISPGTELGRENVAAQVRMAILNIRKRMNKENVPQVGRHLVVGSDVEAVLLLDPHLIKASWAGDDNALRDAQVGKIYGFDVYCSNSVPVDSLYAFHSSALQLVSMAPAAPQGAPFVSSLSSNSMALRYIRDYDFSNARDRSLINTYLGVGEVKDFPWNPDDPHYGQDPTKPESLTQLRGFKANLVISDLPNSPKNVKAKWDK